MTMQDPSARLSRDAARSRRRRLLPAGLRLSGLRLRRRRGSEVRLRERSRRQLAALDRALAAEAPGLASMFVLFNQFNKGEDPAGPERVPAPVRPRPQRTHIAVLLVLAAIVALCIALSTQIHAPVPPCPSSAGTSASASAVPATGPLVQELSCPAYATNK
jgi:Protein of unknown function (DUF3040)